MNQPNEEPISLDHLLEVARNASVVERPQAMRAIAEALCDKDPFTVAIYTEQLKAYGLCNKTDLMQAVKDAQKEASNNAINPKNSNKPTDDELAKRWLTEHPRTAYGLGEFRRYENGVWPVVDADVIKREVLDVLDAAKPEGIRPTKHLLQSTQEIGRVKVSIPNDKWDTQPEYLPCQNGVLHIPKRTLLHHSPDYNFTTGLVFDYDPEAKCPKFTHFLTTTVSEEVKCFLQEYAGYALTTDTSYEIAVWLYGPPGGGKSTFLTGLHTMLGPRAGLLGLIDIERSRFALTNLPGKTLVSASEQPARHFYATHILNAIISGEPIEVERKYREPYEFIPYAKVIWAMNELPVVKSASNGLFRRVKVVRFPAIPESDQDITLKDAVKTEGPGILNWALDGLVRLRQLGHFEIPQDVHEATKDFKTYNDIPAHFVAECCVTGPDYKTQSAFLYHEYQDWCNETGNKPESITKIAED